VLPRPNDASYFSELKAKSCCFGYNFHSDLAKDLDIDDGRSDRVRLGYLGLMIGFPNGTMTIEQA
jgi:hypothetical protein